MKRFSILGCIAAALVTLAGCEPSGNTDYLGTNYIYLSSEAGKTTLLGASDDVINLNVSLSSALKKDLVLNFEVEGTNSSAIELIGNPVTIPAGSKTASFTVSVDSTDGLTEKANNFKVSLNDAVELPEAVVYMSDFSFVVVVLPIPDLTAEQNNIVNRYLSTTGINLAEYLGEVNVTVEYTGFDNENEVPLDPVTFTDKSIITLSEESTEELPVLKMIYNPMGIQDKMYETLRSVTVEDSEYWTNAEYYPVNTALMEKISWNANSQESFLTTLDGIKVNADKTVEFLGTGADQYGDEIIIVPFSYDFTAYNRELLLSDEEIGRDENTLDATANPAFHLNNYGVEEDYLEYGNWVEAEASISAEALTFTFCVYMCANDYDYTKIVATYTPNN